MKRERRRSIHEGLLAVSGLVSVLGLAACSTPAPGSTAYKQGTLGNGGFLFQCDDSVACDRWSTNNAKDFPTQIATGSTFHLTFVASQDQGDVFSGNAYPGSTLNAVAPYVSSGPDGFTMVKPGYGAVVVRQPDGAVIDYVTLKILKPDALVVYAAEYKGDNPPPVDSLSLKVNDRKSFRTVGQKDKSALAGSIRVEWTSADPNLLTVESYAGGVVNIVAKAAGTTTLTAAGAALTKAITVQVNP
jgi:hypothetical protein